jgi:hypothetical protein
MRLFPLRTVGQHIAGALLLTAAVAPLPAQEHPLRLPQQPGRHTPLDQNEVPGKVAHWNLIAKPSLYGYYQPVQIVLPSHGLVSFYTPEQSQPVLTQAPAQAGMLIGPVYRVKIAGLPEYPGVELYPTIEVVDRLHPPCGREQEFPIPVEITPEEIEAALNDQMVTKVVYLERPQTASQLKDEQGRTLTFDAPPASNLLDAADQLGRPMAILRIGGRVPDPLNPAEAMFTTAAPIQITPVGGQ